MKLADKGHYAPPPALDSVHAQRVADAIASWPEVHARTHWQLGDETIVDGADFYLGDEELGHVHLYAEAHVALPPSVVEALLRAKLGERFPWGRGFVVFRIRKVADVEHALWLFRLSYDHRSGLSSTDLLARIEATKTNAAFVPQHAE